MRFAEFPYLYYGVAALVAFFLFYFWVFRSRARARGRFAQESLLKVLLIGFDPKRQRIKAFFVALALALSFLALARPQWGFRWEETKRKGLDILIALDTSKSMLAEDVKPNRLERSKWAIKDLVKELSGDRIGLIAFAGSAFLECPLTVDYGGFMLSLEGVDAQSIPRPGTSISSALREAMRSYEGGEKKYKVLVIISDGEDLEGDALRLAQEAKNEGILIYAIGIGTPEGDLIPVTQPDGSKGYLKDKNGNVVKTRLDEKTMEEIALKTGGSYVRATSVDFGLDVLYRQKISKLEKKEQEGKMAKYYFDRFQIPLAFAFIVLFMEMWIKDGPNGD